MLFILFLLGLLLDILDRGWRKRIRRVRDRDGFKWLNYGVGWNEDG